MYAIFQEYFHLNKCFCCFSFPRTVLSKQCYLVNTGFFCFLLGMTPCHHMRNLLLYREAQRGAASIFPPDFLSNSSPSLYLEYQRMLFWARTYIETRNCYTLKSDPAYWILSLYLEIHKQSWEISWRSFLAQPLPFILEEGVVDTALTNSTNNHKLFVLPALHD